MLKPLRPFEPYKIDTYFKDRVIYGLHEGCDYNGLGGGNTDLNTPLHAPLDGEIVHASVSTKDYGKLIVVHCKTPMGDRWIRYAHCNNFATPNGLVKRGEVIAYMGSTGNSTASHLHLDVLKKIPPTWRYYGKAAFDEYFVDPEEFFNTDIMEAPVNNLTEDQLMALNLLKIVKEKHNFGNLESTVRGAEGAFNDISRLQKETSDAKVELEATIIILETERDRILSLESENFEIKKQNQKLREEGVSFTKGLSRWLYGIALAIEADGKRS